MPPVERREAPDHVRSALVFDASLGVWYAEVGVTDEEAHFQGSGPDPASAALQALEHCYAAWCAARWPELPVQILTVEDGWLTYDADGCRVVPDATG